MLRNAYPNSPQRMPQASQWISTPDCAGVLRRKRIYTRVAMSVCCTEIKWGAGRRNMTEWIWAATIVRGKRITNIYNYI